MGTTRRIIVTLAFGIWTGVVVFSLAVGVALTDARAVFEFFTYVALILGVFFYVFAIASEFYVDFAIRFYFWTVVVYHSLVFVRRHPLRCNTQLTPLKNVLVLVTFIFATGDSFKNNFSTHR